MKLGYFDFNPDYSIRPDDLARACEERGYDSLWLGEHINIPVSRRTPYPLGGELPKYYSHMRDPFISLMAAGAATKSLKLATGICLMIERDPITTAKEVATLDSLSNGRVIFGIGAGWNAEEMENHGTRFDRRWKVLRERVLAMKTIWTEEVLPQTCPETPSTHHHGQRQGTRPAADCRLLRWPEESKLHQYRELGVERVVLGVGRSDVDVKEKVLPFLDRYAKLIPKLV